MLDDKKKPVISATGVVVRNFVYACCDMTKNNLVGNAAYFNGAELPVGSNNSVKKTLNNISKIHNVFGAISKMLLKMVSSCLIIPIKKYIR